MIDLVKCPFCDKEIENDSFYCDQCGEELMKCSVHGLKKGKVCNDCGSKLAPAKTIISGVSAPTPQQSQGAAFQTQTASTQAADATISGASIHQQQSQSDDLQAEKTIRPTMAATEPKCLVSNQLNTKLDLKDGAIIGRRAGDFTAVFSSQAYVSGTHARLQKNSSGKWEVVDLDSSNGTFHNKRQLPSNQPCEFQVGDTISFYNLDFRVE